MPPKRDADRRTHPVFWLLLGFLCGVMAAIGGLLLLSGERTGDGDAAAATSAASAPIETPALRGAPPPGGPVIPPPSVEPATPVQESVVRPTLPTFDPAAPASPIRPAPAAAPTPRSAPSRSKADQMAEDAAASGMTARTR